LEALGETEEGGGAEKHITITKKQKKNLTALQGLQCQRGLTVKGWLEVRLKETKRLLLVYLEIKWNTQIRVQSVGEMVLDVKLMDMYNKS
jgi:hypothetical protein